MSTLNKELKKNTSPAGIYSFKVNSENNINMYEICSKLTIKTPERRQYDVNTSFWCLHC